MATSSQSDFYDQLPLHQEFEHLIHDEAFQELPADWGVFCTDIVNSTDLIERGQYKTVNMIGASVIAAVQNALDSDRFPFVFGGDGASFALPASQLDTGMTALARLRRWVSTEFGISLRAAYVPMTVIRQAGYTAKVARYAPSQYVDYAMFTGGGVSWAEHQMKSGAFEIKPTIDTTPPDLTGLSCRWENLPSRNGSILSLVIEPASGIDLSAFATVIATILDLFSVVPGKGNPLPKSGPDLQFPSPGLMTEARLGRGKTPLFFRKLYLLIASAISTLMFRQGVKRGRFDPKHYLSTMSSNADFKKFDDSLKMTLDCPPKTREQLLRVLKEAEEAGYIRYGLHEQDAALVTCIVPSALRDDHVHFVDGAAGGYTRAAAKIRLARRAINQTG